MRGALLLALVAVAAGCFQPANRKDAPPPPRGKSMAEYVHEEPPPKPVKPEGTVDGDTMRLHVIDVGQGTAALLEFPCGAVLLDTGGEDNDQFHAEEALLAYLDRFFDRRRDLAKTLALLAVSHPHIDHTRGIEAVLARYTVKNVIDNGDVREDLGGKPQLALHAWQNKHKKKVGHLDVARGDIDGAVGLTSPVIDPVGACKASQVDPVIRALWSANVGREEIGQNPNNDSVVLRVDFGEASFLLPGDLEILAIAQLVKKYADNPAMLDADVYLVPHHGSRNSSTQDFVAQVSPQVAVISCGPYDRYLQTEEEYTARVFGHPHEISVGHLTHPKRGVTGRRDPVEVWVGKRGAWKERKSEFTQQRIDRAVYATGWDGDVVVSGNANGWVEVTTSRGAPASNPPSNASR
ncbi:MAG TPA: MBL fold metallo-hydrolase [Kofleriaceae bacterium]|nr:MBL fold metallo-hydrolase [Kofleriaceae bacterium]